jgi:hypothetical protein
MHPERRPRFSRHAILPLVGGTTLATALIFASLAGCGSKKAAFDPTGTGAGDDSGVASSDDGGGFNNINGNLNLEGGGGTGTANSMCKGGFYEGQFDGLYSSHLTLFGINLLVTGDVKLTLQQQAGSGTKMCTFAGETTSCSSFFSVQNGTIDGVANQLQTEAGSLGGFPYHCVLTGTLSCPKKKLVNGWINCTYCVGNLNDGGMSCMNGGSGNGAAEGGLTGTGGQFGGPLTADYFYNSTGAGGAGAIDGGGKDPAPAFGTAFPPSVPPGYPFLGPPPAGYDPGDWNGSESLYNYWGMGPLPDGGTVSDYLSDAGYGRIGVPNDFGGYGQWWATYQHP